MSHRSFFRIPDDSGVIEEFGDPTTGPRLVICVTCGLLYLLTHHFSSPHFELAFAVSIACYV